jgi:hypothetical protein
VELLFKAAANAAFIVKVELLITIPPPPEFSTACAPVALFVPMTRPPVAVMLDIVMVPLEEKTIARVEAVPADPVALQFVRVGEADPLIVRQFAEPACMYAPVML